MNRLLRILIVVVVAFIAVIGGRWYAYVTNTTDPFDEVGIELNSRMPGPLNAWGCSRLKETFGNKTLPPYGCAAGGGTAWK
ncbi:hypothetical protein [Labrys monachus]|jgi:hypothetical protein|uniref:Uncharacterized protein n=1 Tax=Labrys monachus TaxID=217067 RepID=A0ABU0F9U4_9HYPH|nr:hypothetical protein [Labrys monachus]MDQ0391201.1 hypothetical protein [Labrys monachus]